MTNEDRIRALEKIAQSSEEQKAFLEGQAKAHGDYAKSRTESADSLSGWGTMVGVGGGAAGGAMTLKGVKQMLDKGVKYNPATYSKPAMSERMWRHMPESRRLGDIEPADLPLRVIGKPKPKIEVALPNGGGVMRSWWPGKTQLHDYGGYYDVPVVEGGPVVSRPKVAPKLQGKRLALKGGLLGLGSLGLSAVLHGMASSNREKANEHTKSLEQLNAQLR